MSHPFLDAWAKWEPHGSPFILPEDEATIAHLIKKGQTCAYSNWTDYFESEEFCRSTDKRLHLGLLPQPFGGDPLTARVVVLLLNPGLGPHDAFAELTQPEFKEALMATLRRTNNGFLFLNPRFGWHGGFQWWNRKLQRTIQELAKRWGISFSEARARISQTIATVEMVPYHSASFGLSRGIVKNMRSAQLAREFVHEILHPRAEAGDCLILALRFADRWGLSESQQVVTYTGTEARSAHMTPSSRGGKRLLDYLASGPHA